MKLEVTISIIDFRSSNKKFELRPAGSTASAEALAKADFSLFELWPVKSTEFNKIFEVAGLVLQC